MKQESLHPSEILKTFLDFIENARSEYDYNLESMKKEERITQDYLHILELDGLNYRERSKIATQLAQNRRDRRHFKDAVQELEPIVEFLEDSKNSAVLNSMSQLLGQLRKVESYHKRRFYIPREIGEECHTIHTFQEQLEEIS